MFKHVLSAKKNKAIAKNYDKTPTDFRDIKSFDLQQENTELIIRNMETDRKITTK